MSLKVTKYLSPLGYHCNRGPRIADRYHSELWYICYLLLLGRHVGTCPDCTSVPSRGEHVILMTHFFQALRLWTKLNQISTLTFDVMAVRPLLVQALDIFHGTLRNGIFITSRSKGLTGDAGLV